jgi:hypothetical protein
VISSEDNKAKAMVHISHLEADLGGTGTTFVPMQNQLTPPPFLQNRPLSRSSNALSTSIAFAKSAGVPHH